MLLQFVTVDVFTTRQFGGNPLAVVLGAEGLSTGQMLAIAAEFNLSETTFVLPPRDAAHTAEVRIFTPRSEMPFAGHPNVGTAFVLGRRGESHGRPIAGDRLVFEEGAGLVAIDLLRDGGAVCGARLAAPQPLSIGAPVAPEVVAAASSLSLDAINLRHHPPCIASCGAAFIFAELKDRTALAAAAPRTDEFTRHFSQGPSSSLFLYVRADGRDADIYCRMFAPLHGIVEDPATGSANVALAALLASLRPEADLSASLKIIQGVEMGRPSLIEATARKQGGTVVQTTIAGRCVTVMEGVIDLAG
jgi:trans-2,3-dihydro-3-hydroxyanthranilate isomerase